jgi:Protein of unknown function (DUF3592)
MSTGLRIFLTLICTGAVLFFDGWIANELQKQFTSCRYPSVTGRITDSEIRSHHSSRHGTSYSAYVSYTYQVGRQMMFGQRVRYTSFFSSSHASAKGIVDDYPVGSAQTIFYNPLNSSDSLLGAGIIGPDFVGLLFLTPFNMLMIGLWASLIDWLRERWFKPLAGGVKIIADGLLTRIRLPQTVALRWGLGTTGILALVSSFIMNSLMQASDESLGLAWSAIGISYLAGIVVYGFLRMKAESGRYDLIIDEPGRKLSLPPTYDRGERLMVDATTVNKIRVETVEHRGNRGGIRYTYAPTLSASLTGIGDQKLADWPDKLKAEDFSRWLAEKLGVPIELRPGD